MRESVAVTHIGVWSGCFLLTVNDIRRLVMEMMKDGEVDVESLKKKSKLELIEGALLKHVSGAGWVNTCGSDAGPGCWHDTCYDYRAPQ